jgi:acetylornithine deacetylase/succinyl-diaminopimelate desuccinylase-like protein
MTDARKFIEENKKTVNALFDAIEKSRDDLIALIREIAEIPAPSLHEEKRTEHLLKLLPTLGLKDVHALAKGSVLGTTRSKDEKDVLLLAAHIDTVFPAETDITTRIEGNILHGPGTGDNSTNVAGILTIARLLKELGIRPARNVAFCGNVCEEGRGGLAGIREVVEGLGDRLGEVIAVDGQTSSVVVRSLAIRRHLIRIKGPGGHSWGNFGRPSAIHEMGRIMQAVCALPLPKDPKTTFNFGVIRGGRSVNAIAQECEAEVDLRSLETKEMQKLESSLMKAVHNLSSEELTVETEVIDERPGAAMPEGHRLTEISVNSGNYFGFDVKLEGSSMDTAIPLSKGIPAVGFGIYRGAGAHTLEEHVNLDSLTEGLKRLALTVLMLTGVES